MGEFCEGDLLNGEERARVRMKVRMRAIYHNVVMYTATHESVVRRLKDGERDIWR